MLDDLATAIIFPDRFIDKGLIPAPCPVRGVQSAGGWVYREIKEILISAEVNRRSRVDGREAQRGIRDTRRLDRRIILTHYILT